MPVRSTSDPYSLPPPPNPTLDAPPAPPQLKWVVKRAKPQAEYVAGPAGFQVPAYLRALRQSIDDITADFGIDLYEKMMLDPQIASCLRTQLDAILSDGVQLRPAIDDDDDPDFDLAKQYLEECERAVTGINLDLDSLTRDGMLAMAFGNRVAEKTLRVEQSGQDAGLWVLDKVKVKSARATAFVVDAFANVIGLLALVPGSTVPVTQGIGWLDPKDVENILPREKFVVWTWDQRESDPRGRSILRPCYNPWWVKTQQWTELLKYLAQFASPSVIGYTAPAAETTPQTDPLGNPIAAPADQPSPQQDMLNTLIQFRNSCVAAFPNGAKVDLFEAKGDGGAHRAAIELCDKQMEKVISLQTLAQTEAMHGTRAQAQVHQDTMGLGVKRAKQLAGGVLTRDLFQHLVVLNHGEQARRLAPYASLSGVEQQDKATMLNAYANAVKANFLKPSQFPEIYEDLGLPAASPDELTPPTPAVPTQQPTPDGEPTPAEFSADDDGNGHWITIGGREGEGGEKHGGSPVFIKDGHIVKGAPSLVGKKIGALKEEARQGTHRQQLAQGREYSRARYAKQARKEGIDPKELHQVAAEFVAHDKALAAERVSLLQDARRQFKHYGYDARSLNINLKTGHVEDNIPALDVVAESMARKYPHQFAGHATVGEHFATEGNPSERLLDMLHEGNPKPMDEADAYEHALEVLREHKASGIHLPASSDEEIPFSADFAGEGDGHWVTMNGRHVFVQGGLFGGKESSRLKQGDLFAPAAAVPASIHHPAKVAAALDRYASRDQTAKGGGLFGGEDLQGRRGFDRLPDGAPIVFTEGEFAGQTGKIVRDKDNKRIAAEVDGRPGLVPVDYTSIEPLNAAQSWRTVAASAPLEQKSLLTAEHFLGPRKGGR